MQRIGHRAYTTFVSRSHQRGSLALFQPSTLAYNFCLPQKSRQLVTAARNSGDLPELPHMTVDDRSFAQNPGHVGDVSEHLERDGILKISLRFPDDKSQYLENLVVNLHKQCGHGLPITHSASRGWFWDVRPQEGSLQPVQDHRARSETMENFPWHTDCSYEDSPPRYFALHVLQPDRYGGGTLSVMKVDRVWEMLSPKSRDALSQPLYRIKIPLEFIKQPDQRHIVDNLLAVDRGRVSPSTIMRFREDIVSPLNADAEGALSELKSLLRQLEADSSCVLHLTPNHLPQNAIILMDNRRWLHSRNAVQDPARHLRRVRWDSIPFSKMSCN
ncbi:hypothetical protein FE257_008943 [Aspergillus nanangensis]|uniref:TauD/TfdA-like domain-containing protein n=1 Tax=Aspergillus nanangensis TaxID=2582783 RepID=A0AAD4CYD8_ASPNN|nr:hypothetical protein FE257_008943 [Aspergillus nanangensis]